MVANDDADVIQSPEPGLALGGEGTRQGKARGEKLGLL